MRLEENSPLWEAEIEILKKVLGLCCQSHKGILMTIFIADHGPIPERFGDEIKELLGIKIDE